MDRTETVMFAWLRRWIGTATSLRCHIMVHEISRPARLAAASLHIVAIPGDRYSKIIGKNMGTSDESSS